MARAALCPFVLAALLAGCGGGGGETTAQSAQAISLGHVVRCLRREVRDGRVSTALGDLDQIARRATAGAAAVRFGVSPGAPKGTNIATVVLERSIHEAGATEARYRAVYRALGGNAAGLLTRTANAVVAFGAAPSRPQRRMVARCLQVRG